MRWRGGFFILALVLCGGVTDASAFRVADSEPVPQKTAPMSTSLGTSPSSESRPSGSASAKTSSAASTAFGPEPEASKSAAPQLAAPQAATPQPATPQPAAPQPAAPRAAPPLDYWEKDARLWRKITEKRQIVVSAKNESGRTVSKGVGLARQPLAKVWAFANDPEKIKKTSRFLKDFTWNRATGDVKMQIEILTISYTLRGRAIPKPDPENPRIEFTVLEGDLVPFTAELELRSPEAQAQRGDAAPRFSAGHTLVRIEGRSAKDRALNWPMRVGLEILLQRTAGALREAVEAETH